ncbi:MAG: hypothetical protein HQL84_17715 [Magnetococcales bacterium]|nr:hypothetical protein [Magnetococcales bacterium]MBF0151858.1 hypothetical protein [Magnetococcales bacterium]MBF0629544.1 hypothetical protein [Magnetococcales bacterium]
MTVAATNLLLDVTPAEADEPFELITEESLQEGSTPVELAYTSATVFVEDLQK